MHYSTTPLLPSLALYFVQSSSYGILTFPTFGNPSGGFVSTRTYLRRHPTADWQMHVLSMGGGTTPAQQSTMPTIDGWSKSWAVVMNHGGIPAGQTLWWKWSVTKIAG
jgi:hypothetical protein